MGSGSVSMNVPMRSKSIGRKELRRVEYSFQDRVAARRLRAWALLPSNLCRTALWMPLCSLASRSRPSFFRSSMLATGQF